MDTDTKVLVGFAAFVVFLWMAAFCASYGAYSRPGRGGTPGIINPYNHLPSQ